LSAGLLQAARNIALASRTHVIDGIIFRNVFPP
jgi:hypothetical protein